MNEPQEERDVHAELAERLEAARLGGPEKYRQRHVEAGKLLVRERLKLLLDAEVEFEDGLLARSEEGLAGDAVVTAVGKIGGRTVCVIANDYTVKAGTWGRRTFDKITRMQEVAGEIGAPLVYLVDSAGARIDEQFESYAGRHAWGNIFYNQVQLSGRVPQVCIMFGPSPAGSAYVPALCDLTVMVEGAATAYLGSPRMSEMATGEKVTLEEMGGARMHCEVSGLGDALVASEHEALGLLRDWIGFFPSSWRQDPVRTDARPPVEGPPIDMIVPKRENVAFDIHRVVSALVDQGSFLEYKALFARELVTGLARLDGWPVGIVANDGILFSASALKGAHFVELCAQRKIPLVFLQNITGFMVGREYEAGGIAKDGAKMVTAVACAEVPKFTILIGGSFGAGNYAMAGRAYQPRFLWTWPNSRISVMGGTQAARVLSTVGGPFADDAARDAFEAPILETYEREGSPYFATARLWDDGVIDPLDTRRVLSLGIEAALHAPIPETRFGIFRM